MARVKQYGVDTLRKYAQELSNWSRSTVRLIFVYKFGSDREEVFNCNHSTVDNDKAQETIKSLVLLEKRLSVLGGAEFEEACGHIQKALLACGYKGEI